MQCPTCGNLEVTSMGLHVGRWHCMSCRSQFTPNAAGTGTAGPVYRVNAPQWLTPEMVRDS